MLVAGTAAPAGPRSICPALLRAHDRTSRDAATRNDALMLDALPKAFFSLLAGSQTLKHAASRYGMRRPDSFARRFVAGEQVADAIAAAQVLEQNGLAVTLDLLGESVSSTEAARRRDAGLPLDDSGNRARRHQPQHLAQAHAARARRRPGDLGRQPAPRARRRGQARVLRPHRHGELPVHRRRPSRRSRRRGASGIATSASCCSRTSGGRWTTRGG